MKAMFLRWLVTGILGLGVIFTVSSEDIAEPEPKAVTLTQEEIETILDTKFSEGKYSRRGPDGCLRCHDDTSNKPATGIFDNIHGKSANLHGPMNDKQCEACHGPANNHARNPRKGQVREPMITFGPNSPVPAEKQNSVCLSCHQDAKRSTWHSSEHAFEGLSCASCHQLHQKDDPMMVAEMQADKCTDCHSRTKSDIHKRSRHPIIDGVMTCSSCHNPHQALNEASLNWSTVNNACYECHAEKRGPFLWEHEPVTEDCTSCHTPHGSVNKALLNKRLPMLCQECHRVPHANVAIPENDLRVRGGSCLNCHNQVHGSNHPRGQTLSY
ncbi:DmsE family decaheme c-type cytochrome [Vibrio diabolicus]|uniref:DmsE family decaheme c-type cytochrome n=1 Tax=Vibrio diabolicus TaxID=50719 RepID=UPI0029417548|nr:DmsE family decaheme c-type cytochrome [Vibrio diabolicus]MDV5083055.1 DmsE family decaheme c-type cytochrome [Vibrio diabolicus]